MPGVGGTPHLAMLSNGSQCGFCKSLDHVRQFFFMSIITLYIYRQFSESCLKKNLGILHMFWEFYWQENTSDGLQRHYFETF